MTNVAAALTSLTQDLESVLQDLTSFGEMVTIPHGVLIPAITRHLASTETSDRAIKALSILCRWVMWLGIIRLLLLCFCIRMQRVSLRIFAKLEWS